MNKAAFLNFFFDFVILETHNQENVIQLPANRKYKPAETAYSSEIIFTKRSFRLQRQNNQEE